MWNKRYRQKTYAYGINPNEFLKDVLKTLPLGKILLPADGEGRNAVYAAQLGWEVDAIDLSEEGQAKALKLAVDKGVNINYQLADVTTFQPNKQYDCIAFVFLHLSPTTRKEALQRYIPLLKPNGKIIVEVFNKGQLGRSSGGPKKLPMLYSLNELKDIFEGMQFEYAEDVVIELDEGPYHQGKASTSRIIVTH